MSSSQPALSWVGSIPGRSTLPEHTPQVRAAQAWPSVLPWCVLLAGPVGVRRAGARAVAGAVKTCWSQNVLGMLRSASICCECVAVVILAAVDGGPALSSGAFTASLPQHIHPIILHLDNQRAKLTCMYPLRVACPVPGAGQVSLLMLAKLVWAGLWQLCAAQCRASHVLVLPACGFGYGCSMPSGRWQNLFALRRRTL